MPTPLISTCSTQDPLDQCQLYNDITFSSLDKPQIGILITPICDIAQGDADFLNFCPVLPFKQLFFKYIKVKLKMDEEQFKSAELGKDKINALTHHIYMMIANRVDRHHWLGILPTKEGYWYVDYQLIQSYNREQIDLIKNRKFANISTPLKESIYVKFSNYLGRVGLQGENDEKEVLAKAIFQKYKE